MGTRADVVRGLMQHVDISRCAACGGEMQLEYFDRITHPVEWFMRCRACGRMTAPTTTPEGALAHGALQVNLIEGETGS